MTSPKSKSGQERESPSGATRTPQPGSTIKGQADLSDEELTKKVAELCGWLDVMRNPRGQLRGFKTQEDADQFGEAGHFTKIVPSYSTDLNAMAEAEKTMDAVKASK